MTLPFTAFNQRRTDVLASLVKLREQARALGAQTLSQRIAEQVVDKLAEDRFHLVVVGEFNHGKTTLVNALLGAEVLPVGVTPTTAVIHHVGYAASASACLVREDGRRDAIPMDALAELTAEGEGVGEAALKHVEIALPSALLEDRIVLVDTPGVNDLCLQRADVTYKYIPQADAVLFVIDAGQPLKESERVFLRDKLLGQSRDKIIFVVTKADIWNDDERRDALAYIQEELGSLVEGPVVFPVAALQALAGEAEGSGMPELVAHLTAFLAEERGKIMLDNALGEGLRDAMALGKSVAARRRAAVMTSEEIARRMARVELDLEGQQQTMAQRQATIREEVAAIRAWMQRDVARFRDDMLRQLPALVDQASAEQLRVHFASFLEATFFEWAQRQATDVARALEELAEKTVALMQESAHEAAKRLDSESDEVLVAADVRVDTMGYDMGVAAMLSFGVGMFYTNLLAGALLTGAAPVLAYYLRGRVEMQTREKAKAQASMAVREATLKLVPKLEEMIVAFAEHLQSWLLSASQQVHQEMLDVLQAARDERERDDHDGQDALDICDASAAQLAKLVGQLEALREALGPAGGEAE